jgi:hypothetical protein
MTELFQNPELKAEFAEKGYLMLPLLDQSGVKTLKQLYKSLDQGGNDGFFTSMNLENNDDRRRVDARIKELVAPKVESLLPGYRPLLGNFTIKDQRGDSDLRLHLDWSVVDERQFRAIGIWIPMEDVDEHNGALGVLEGSHAMGFSRRGSMVNFVAYSGSDAPGGFLKTVKENYPAKLLCLKAGTAVIYDLSLGHFSPPNQSKNLRLATNLMMIPKAAQPLHYGKKDGKTLQVLQVDDDFFVTRNMSAPPDFDRYPVLEVELGEGEVLEEQYGTEVKIDEGEYSIDRRLAGESQTGKSTKRPWWKTLFR